jgi:hypothetical protein
LTIRRLHVTLAATLFALAAVGGVALAGMRLSGKELPPLWLAVIHGLAAAAGLVLLIIAVMGSGVPSTATIALVGFVVAALGGFALFANHLRGKALPIPLVFIHGIVAVVSFVVLLVGILGLGG